jgi:ferric-dicitrate binding protein FerR (iron transport regulator)
MVILKGEAFFEVAHDANKAFVIQVNGANVEVLGTSFNVQGYESRTAIEVTVQTGVVKFSVPELQQEVKLVAGQQGVYSKGNQQLTSAPNADLNFLSWNTRKLVFMENDLRTVVETLNKTYQAEIVLATDIPGSCVVTVTFDQQTLEAVLHVLETTLNLTYRKTGNRIEIIRAGC